MALDISHGRAKFDDPPKGGHHVPHHGLCCHDSLCLGFAPPRPTAAVSSEGVGGDGEVTMESGSDPSPLAVLARLNAAMNRHDLEAFVACFDPQYESEQPAHPDRRFRGAAQVRSNWAAMFAGVPDFRAEIVRSAAAGETAWVEWRWCGTRADGSALDARGICVFGMPNGLIAWGRLCMEDVEVGSGIEAAVTALAEGRTATQTTSSGPTSRR